MSSIGVPMTVQAGNQKKCIVLADDFTGANDAGVSLTEAGMVVDVIFQQPYLSKAQAIVLNSDSRAYSASDAAQQVTNHMTALLADQPGMTVEWFIKKIDSTMRGNPGAETEAVLQATGINLAVIAPAFPAAGRTTQNGECLVSGKLLTATEFASDPKTPILSADISDIVQKQSRISCINVRCSDLARHAQEVREGMTALIVDAKTDAELDHIVEICASLRPKPLLVGSAGLCDAFARYFTSAKKYPGLFAVVGSMSEVAQRQLALAAEHPRVEHVYIDTAELLEKGSDRFREAITCILRHGSHCLVHTCCDSGDRQHIQRLCEQRGITRKQLGEKISFLLGELVHSVVRITPPKALYLSGGDVATATATALGATGFRIRGRAAGCVPYGHLLGCDWNQTVFTKAGAFGDETTLLKILSFVEEKTGD
ncbi:four-carbon acid sugar kinase family protein [Pantoea allii]|uniref:D-threonate kinase n=1 Tax=Pantoea allii TaxID=574096 RepID=UPI0024B75814|nr:four-carbon acid sugar kinase family protein [Pantoea allii]MDJ0035456.1 four-carbon acid sugar kinase family protein [Pantoea allii]